MFRFTIRDVLWLTVVVGIAMGWWLDRDRIRQQTEAPRAAMQRWQTLPLRRAEAALRVTEAEWASLVEINQRNPGAVSESELRRLESQLDVARLDAERASARNEFGPLTPSRP